MRACSAVMYWTQQTFFLGSPNSLVLIVDINIVKFQYFTTREQIGISIPFLHPSLTNDRLVQIITSNGVVPLNEIMSNDGIKISSLFIEM